MGAFALTIFTGAFLLFQVQLLIGKYILPWFGGSPNVWTTCMLFFQVLLLGGYAYAHLTSRWFRPRTQAIFHLILLLAALFVLPITPSDSWKPSGSGNPILRILALLTVSLGLPYFVLSSTGPLMQQWFTQTNPGRSPYRLYALSNAGSLLALVSYPFLFEPHLTRAAQAATWACGLVVFVICCGFCAFKLFKSKGQSLEPKVQSPKSKVQESAPILGAQAAPSEAATRNTQHATCIPPLVRILWLALPACASVLLLATTNKICQDVAVIPFLWVVPLALYLLSFIICFDSPRWYARFPFALALIPALGAMCWAIPKGHEPPLSLLLPIYCVGLFVCCMVCHGELYRLKPDPARLTSFYLMVAAGGALGGIFVALVAPLVFDDYYELHYGLFLCGLLFLITYWEDNRWGQTSKFDVRASPFGPRSLATPPRRGGGLTLKPLIWRRWVVTLGSVALAAFGFTLWFEARKAIVLKTAVCQSRNFYGVLTVCESGNADPKSHSFRLIHGGTVHGMQWTDPLLSFRRTTYYGEHGGAGLAFRSLSTGSRRIGLVGLGVGTLTSYAQTGDYVRVYEINPEVQRLASSKFTYLADCLGRVEFVLGDARLSLEAEPPQNFDLLALDAFSSDAIPVHLLTREAFAVYGRHLKTNGVIAVHVSNKALNLEPVILQLALHFGYDSAIVPHATTKIGVYSSTWILLSRNAEIIHSRSIQEVARPAKANWQRVPLWTDDFTSLFHILGTELPHKVIPDPADEQYKVATKLYDQGDYVGASTRYRLALQSDPNLPEALNNLAWLLATTPNASLRNGAEAVQLGEKACELTRYRVPALIGTLAAAYAEAGRFDAAVTTVQKACALASKAGEKALLGKNQQLLELYRAHKPYREIGDR